MFLISSLLASSMDGFLSGFLLKSAGIYFKKSDYFKIFCTISISCLLASEVGKVFSKFDITSYINILGALIMLYLAFSAFNSKDNINNFTNPVAIAISLSADASIVCMYFGMSGYNILEISVISGFLHTFLMIVGTHLSNSILGNRFSKLSKLIAGLVFFTMAIFKIKSIV